MAFCEKCGAQLPAGARFCEKCGAPVSERPAPAACGASVLPDYVIEGDTLPVLTVRLNTGEKIYSQVGGRSWSRGSVNTETKGRGAGKALGRLLMGESLFVSEYSAYGPAEVAFTSSFPGKILAKKLAPGESVICQKSAFLCATDGVELSVHFQKKIGAGFFGGEGFIMQKLTGPGMVWLEVDGYCKEVSLAPGERITCDTGVVAVMEESCTLDITTVKGVKNVLFGGEGLFDTVVTGPGRVWLQSMTISKLAGEISRFIPSKN